MILKKFFRKKLYIFYRHVHIPVTNLKKRPSWFNYELSFNNLIKTLRTQESDFDITLTIMFDGSEESYHKDFVSIFANKFQFEKEGFNFKVHLIKAGSDARSFHQTLDYVKSLPCRGADLIYILENDYLHVNNWTAILFSLIDGKVSFDYLSLYDHNDKYFLPQYEGLVSKIYYSGHHWRTTPSTCGTFIARYQTLVEDLELIKDSGGDFHFFKALREKNSRQLLTPIPGLSTHCMDEYMSPGVDWDAIAKMTGTL